MPKYTKYECGKCGVDVTDMPNKEELLLAKSIVFKKIGAGKNVIRSRTIEWLCVDCAQKDEHWNLPANQSPGMKSPALERVRRAQGAT